MDSALNIAGVVLAVLGCALLIHVTLPPVLHRRAIVWRGVETMLATIALLGAAATQWLPAVSTVLLAVIIAQVWGPWVIWGVGAPQTLVLAKRSASMVRARFEPVPQTLHAVVVGDAATVRAYGLGSRATLLILTGRRTPKVKLWRNVLRKQAANQRLSVG